MAGPFYYQYTLNVPPWPVSRSL